ncbi:SDR family NAD(P)-dependent oxidoreductase [Aliiglaciecola lipolytica]|uniref:SDR family NAD(P)-dependent oxidoreductase n=1 Tax=Aliiglaciecola lipolytica TaxID=477689 RepID=UPI001C0A4CBD|nr:SDR family NAD(P)-dependent oxidoreductase [Aliiglaciecola lipolytica]MBU2879789.1 SDR family NAD(P)-dependent oxidoreductase [Aliiglaciecola lipolytica]
MKTILITGATSGIGKALTLLCAQKNYKVIACGRNQDALEALAKYDNISTLKFDIANQQQVADALQNVHPDIAVLNAGVCEYVDIDCFEVALFKRVFDVNFMGVVNCTASLIKASSPPQQIVIVDSLARLLPFTRSQAYGASKAALHYFSKSMQVDLAPKNILIQSASPGFVETPLTDKNDFEMPMKISVNEAADALLVGIEQRHSSIYFPKKLSFILRFLNLFPAWAKFKISSKMKNTQDTE